MPSTPISPEVMRRIETLDARCRQAHDELLTLDEKERQRLHVESAGGATVHVDGVKPRLGRVYGFGMYEPATPAALDAILAVLKREHVTATRFRVPPTEQRQNIVQWLTQRGFAKGVRVVQWLARTGPARAVETSYEIGPLKDLEAPEFGRLIAVNYRLKEPDDAAFHARLIGMPGMACYVARDGAAIIGTGAVHREGDGCILEYGTTLKSHRQQGIQRAMIGHRLNEAARLGCTWACASTIGADRSSRNLRRQGFVQAYDEWVYNWQAG